MDSNNVEVVFSFDTTGSMYPCLTQVRRNIKSTVTRLFEEIPGIRIGIIAHGDYCDKGSSYVTKALDLTPDADAICKFVENVEADEAAAMRRSATSSSCTRPGRSRGAPGRRRSSC